MNESHPKPSAHRSAKPWFYGLALVALISLAMVRGLREAPNSPPAAPAGEASRVCLPVHEPPVIDFEALEQDAAAREQMAERKAAHGLETSMDMIVTGQESIRVGDQTVAMSEIQRQIAVKEGRIIESDTDAGAPSSPEVYGIHVVQPGDSLWNIHFALLKDYFKHKKVDLPLWPMNRASTAPAVEWVGC